MISLQFVVAALTGASLFSTSVLAHSVQRNPLNYITVVRDINIHTPSHRVHSNSKFDLTFSLHDGQEPIRLLLYPNHDVLHDDFALTTLDADGNVKSTESVDRSSHKVYKGEAFIERPGEIGWSEAGWARITIHRDGKRPVFDGVFRIDGDHHHVQTGARYKNLKHELDPDYTPIDGLEDDETMVVWRDSDVATYMGSNELKRHLSQRALCDSDSLNFNTQYNLEHPVRRRDQDRNGWLQGVSTKSLFGRQSIDGGSSGGGGQALDLIDSIGKTDGCPTSKKVALVGIATDCTYWQGFNSSDELRKYVVGIVNQASQLYESTFKISLAIKNLTVLEKGCPGTPASATPWNVDCSTSTTITDRLNLFSAWRGRSHDSNAYWTLLTSCPTDAAVGLAWRGQVCRPGSGNSTDGQGHNETVAAANVVVKTSTEWQVFAHETGHTFGAVHDCTSDVCPFDPSNPACCPLSATTCDAGGKYIMNPSTGPGITNFSPCSIGNICSSLKVATLAECLTDNKNVETITGNQCGNGIVEPGEQCDCGGEEECLSNPCCDAETCQFKTGAVCDPSNEDCCTAQCQFASSGTVCRASTGECDVQETCSGSAAKCPDDEHKKDGASCGSGGGGLQCASGQCTSRDRQCQVMVGNSGVVVNGRQVNSNSTRACAQRPDACQITCSTDPSSSSSITLGTTTCLEFGQNFIDGTPCGGGGHCLKGQCKGSSKAQEIKNWIDGHKDIVIPVVSIIGALLLMAIATCFYNACRRYKRRKPKYSPQMSPSWGASNSQWRGVGGGGGDGGGGVQGPQNEYNLNNMYPSQTAPPPAHTYDHRHGNDRGWQRPPRYA